MAEVVWEYPTLAPYQHEWVSDPHRFVAIEGATGTGKTYVFEPFMFKVAHEPINRGDEFWWVTPTIDQARAVYENIKRELEDAGVLAYYKTSDTLREIQTPEGGILCFKTGEKPGNLYGIRNVRGIIVDEFTRCRIELWAAILSVANKTGCWVKLIGNYIGDDSAWHLWIASMTDVPQFKYYKTTAHEAVKAGIMPQDMFDTAQKTLPEVVFKALYLCEGSSDPALLVTYGAVLSLWTNSHVIEGPPAMTCDVAFQGSDEFVTGIWAGLVLKDIDVFTKREPKDVEAIIKGKAIEHSVQAHRIVYDADGMGHYLKSYLQGAIPYQGGTVALPMNGQKLSYQNLRSQCHFLTADAINGGGMWLQTPKFKEAIQQEAFACLRHSGTDAAGRWGIVSKDSTDPKNPGSKMRLGRSPDKFDMIVMRQYLELTPEARTAGSFGKAAAEVRRVKFGSTPRKNFTLEGR